MKSTKPNLAWLVLYLTLSILVLSSIIIENTQFGLIYFVLLVFTLIIYAYSLLQVTKGGTEFVLFSDKAKDFKWQALIGFALGFILVDKILMSQPLFTFLSPLSVPKFTAPLGILGVEVVSQIFVMSVVVAEIEESFRSGALRPTLEEWLKDNKLRAVFFLTMGLLIYAIFPVLRILGIGLILLAFIDALTNWGLFITLFKSESARHLTAIGVAAIIFGLLHLKLFAEGTANESLMVNAMLFAVIADIINWRLKSTVSSKIAHCMNNGVVMCASVGAPTIFGVVMAAVYGGIMWVMVKE